MPFKGEQLGKVAREVITYMADRRHEGVALGAEKAFICGSKYYPANILALWKKAWDYESKNSIRGRRKKQGRRG